MDIIIAIASFIFGALAAFVLRLWDRLTPETRLQWHVQTTSMRITEGMPFDTCSVVTLFNPSKRSKATNVAVIIRVPADSDVQVGDPATTEDPSRLRIDAKPPDADSVTSIRLNAERLAPRSTIEIPMWYTRLSPPRPVSVEGACDQTAITAHNEVRSPDPSAPSLNSPVVSIVAGLALMASGLFVGYMMGNLARQSRTIPAHTLTGPIWSIAPESHQTNVTVPTAPPAPPQVILRDPNTLLVTQSGDADSTCLDRAQTANGPFEFYVIPLRQPQEEATVKLKQPHGAFWIRAYSENAFGRSNPSQPIRVPQSASASGP